MLLDEVDSEEWGKFRRISNQPPPPLISQAANQMKGKDREKIEAILGRSERTAVFTDKLEKWIELLNHPESYYRKPEVSRPRTAAAVQTIEAARKAAARLDKKNQAIRNLHAYRSSRQLSVLDKMSSDIRQYDVFLEELAESMRPLGPTGQSKRLLTERYALRGLMYLFSRHLPNEKIGYTPSSHFYRIADCMLIEIGFIRADLRDLIKQEKDDYLLFLNEYPVSDDDDVIPILMEP